MLTLAQWFSPAFPVGGFAYSHGLEWAIDAGDVTSGAELEAWIDAVLRHGAGQNDALFIAAAYHAGSAADIGRIDATARAFAASRERLKESTLQGAAFAHHVAGLWGGPDGPLSYPVAVGAAARRAALPLPLTTAMYLQAFVSNLTAVGQRLIPIGQTEGQRLIHHFAPLCREIAETCAHGDLEDLSSTAFLADIASMRHETQYSRIFRT